MCCAVLCRDETSMCSSCPGCRGSGVLLFQEPDVSSPRVQSETPIRDSVPDLFWCRRAARVDLGSTYLHVCFPSSTRTVRTEPLSCRGDAAASPTSLDGVRVWPPLSRNSKQENNGPRPHVSNSARTYLPILAILGDAPMSIYVRYVPTYLCIPTMYVPMLSLTKERAALFYFVLFCFVSSGGEEYRRP